MELGKLLTTCGSDKDTRHSYAAVYERLMGDRRLEYLRILEIGIGEGGSLEAWSIYFPNATIVGLDLSLYPSRHRSYRPGVHRIFGDQTSLTNLAECAAWGPFDLIIDDGSHCIQDQLISLHFLHPFLNKDKLALYIIEDIQNPDFKLLFTQSKYGATWEDLRQERPGVHDNILAIIAG
jgi:hypothetical protein